VVVKPGLPRLVQLLSSGLGVTLGSDFGNAINKLQMKNNGNDNADCAPQPGSSVGAVFFSREDEIVEHAVRPSAARIQTNVADRHAVAFQSVSLKAGFSFNSAIILQSKNYL
jgi:hypothetical protein